MEQRKKVIELIHKGRLHLLGELCPQDLRGYYRKCRLLVLPSLSEGLPLVVLEALACGMPVIASNVGSISDVIYHGTNGYLIYQGDVDELAKAILNILTDDHSTSVSNICRESVQEYDIKIIARKYIHLFENILEREQQYVENCYHI